MVYDTSTFNNIHATFKKFVLSTGVMHDQNMFIWLGYLWKTMLVIFDSAAAGAA